MVVEAPVIPDIEQLAASGYLWKCSCALSGQERTLAQELAMFNVPCFLPLEHRRVERSDGYFRKVTRPLLPGYVFYAETDNSPVDVRSLRPCYKIIPVNNQKLFVKQLVDLKLCTESGVNLKRYNGILIGDRCRVTSGHPLYGLDGIFIRAGKHNRKFIIQLLSSGAEAEIAPQFIERCE